MHSSAVLAHTPRLFSLPAPFLKNLAQWLTECIGKENFQECTLFLPYERALPLFQAELQKQVGPCIFPTLRTLDRPMGYTFSVHQNTPFITQETMRGWLFSFLRKKGRLVSQALDLSKSLLDLVTYVGLHGGEWSHLWNIVPEHLTHHFQITTSFLKEICEAPLLQHYTKGLQSYQHQLDQWANNPPSGWVIAAGSGVSLPATAALLKAIKNLSKGIILFSLPCALSGKYEDISHPFYTLSEFLKSTGHTFSDILPLASALPVAQQRSLFFLSTYTSETPCLTAPDTTFAVPCATEEEEALTIAYLMKEASGTALLITPDRTLGRRVFSHLRRLGIDIPPPFETSYMQHPLGTFLLLFLDLILSDFRPQEVLALLRHPLCLNTYPRLEKIISSVLKQLLKDKPLFDMKQFPENIDCLAYPHLVRRWWGIFTRQLQEIQKNASEKNSLKTWITIHLSSIESLFPIEGEIKKALEEWTSVDRFYKGLTLEDYRLLLEAFLTEHTLPCSWPKDAQCRIVGPLEGRLMHADRIVLAGLNEGTWPSYPEAHPFLNRLMKDSLKIPQDLWSIGLSARDFLAGLNGREVFLTRSLKQGGNPMIPSRFFVRFSMRMCRLSSGWTLPSRTSRGLCLKRCPKQSPAPYVKGLPASLSVTDILMVQRDPYEFYLKKLLSLRPLPTLSSSLEKRHWGTLIHKILEDFAGETSGLQDIEDLQNAMATAIDQNTQSYPLSVMQRHRLRFILSTFLKEEISLRQGRPFVSYTERRGHAIASCGSFNLQLSAVADRIDLIEGKMRIIDYKTGRLPSIKEVETGHFPQLMIEGFLAMQGAFIPNANDIESMVLWKISSTDQERRTHLYTQEEIGQGIQNLLKTLEEFSMARIPYAPAEEPTEKSLSLISRQQEKERDLLSLSG